jgi:7,8-dihydropterin-6-yl-methyl-4-(beta-D-ribofuranosyl)aminobenzene 5'-phosphate synthase
MRQKQIGISSLIQAFAACLLALVADLPAGAQQPQRITILYDAFGAKPGELEMDWGFAALVEYGGKRILFDTGNDAQIFASNVKKAGVDLARLDAVVISHRHGDHTSGLNHLLDVNPGVKIYAPVEGAFFKGPVPRGFLTRYDRLPAEMRYFGGKEPARFVTGTPWEKANFEVIAGRTEIFAGFFILTTQSQKPGTMEMNELSLAFRTPQGLAIVAGCSHPGVEKVLENAAGIDPRLYTVTGGFHLVLAERPEIQRVASVLHDRLKVQRVAPGHCTGELGFGIFMERFKNRFDRAGLGAVLPLP